MSPPAKIPRLAGHHVRPDHHCAVGLVNDLGDLAQEGAVRLLAEGEHHCVGLQRLELPGRLGAALGVNLHYLDGEIAAVDRLDRRQPLDLDALRQRFVGLETMSRHVGPVATVDNHRLLGAKATRRAGSVHGSVAAAINHHAAAEQRRLPGLDIVQIRHRIEHLDRVARGNVHVLGEMGADRDEDGVELTRFLFGKNIVDFVIDDYPDAHALNLADLFHQILARQPVGGNAEMQHAAGQRACLVDLHLMAKPRQMIGGRETARTSPDHQYALAGAGRIDRQRPFVLRCEIAQKAFDCVNADRTVEILAVAARFARVIADPAVHARQWVVPDERLPGLSKLGGLGERQPSLDVLAGGAGDIAGRQEIDIDRPLGPHRPRALLPARVDARGHVVTDRHDVSPRCWRIRAAIRIFAIRQLARLSPCQGQFPPACK